MRLNFLPTAALTLALGASLAIASCSRSADPVPLRTFEGARRIDAVCMRVLDDAGNSIFPPVPLPTNQCTAVPPDVIGNTMPNHLFALVTQTTHGEIAVVDLTAGRIVDVDHSVPGTNFLTVGALPTDVASAPDGTISFVTTAEPNKWALWALPSAPPADIPQDSHGILGDDFQAAIPTITDWPVCALPQAPSAITLVPRIGATTGDGGTSAVTAPGYDIAVVLPGTGRSATKIAIVDPMPFIRGAKLDGSDGPSILPGSLGACPITGAIELTGDVPDAVPEGTFWSNGVPYVDGGIVPPLPASGVCSSTSANDAGVDGGTGGTTGTGEDAGTVAIPKLPGDVPRAVNVARDGNILYLADQGLPLIHVLDLSNVAAPRELAPLVATSLVNPTRRVSVGDLAVSPATRDYKRFLYAIDHDDGSLMVFDVTSVSTGTYSRVPMQRPNPEINPFQPADRVAFSASVTSIAFATNDFPLLVNGQTDLTATDVGLLCNPNVNADVDPANGVFRDRGAFYRANLPAGSGLENIVPLGQNQLGPSPVRLRGVFGLATLASGQMAIIDIDDWDSPCRRPDPMGTRLGTFGTELDQNNRSAPLLPPIFSAETNGVRTSGVSDLAPLMPNATSANDLDPYHSAAAFTVESGAITTGVTNEAFFPVSAPHRARSLNFLRHDATTGIHIANLPQLPQFNSKGVPLNTLGANSLTSPLMLPTYSTLPDPAQVLTPYEPDPRARQLSKDQALLDTAHLPLQTAVPDVRFAFEDPLVHVDQDWTVTFEGAIPGFEKLGADFNPIDPAAQDYSAISLSFPNGLLCQRGVQDRRVAAARVQALLATFASGSDVPLSAPAALEAKLGDYAQIIDDIAPTDDQYWTAQEPDGDACWDPQFSTPDARYNVCAQTFGAAADEAVSRDFPILEAYDDHLVLGTYGYYPDGNNQQTTNRGVRGRGAVNAPFLKLARCCFHRQPHVRVRAGAEWIAVGSVSGFLHSMTRGEGGACVPSCNPRDALLNGRAPQVPRPAGLEYPAVTVGESSDAIAKANAPVDARREALKRFLDRNSMLALRNPMFAVVLWNATDNGADTTPQRDMQWTFSTRGQFAPLVVNLATATTSVAPQTVRYLPSVRQIVVIDGSLQGLQLFDIRTLGAVHDPFL